MNNKSFTVIEATVAVFLITVGALGAFTVVQRTIVFSSVISDQLAASYLAQQGIEIARNTRDTNWLEQRFDPGVAWDDGIVSGGETIDKFQREITIQKPEADKMIVTVLVSWGERGRTHEVAAETELYNWK